jgi:hypothetical protein
MQLVGGAGSAAAAYPGPAERVPPAAAFRAACTLAGLQKGRPTPEEGAALAAELFDERLGQMGGRELSNALHAMVKAGHEPANGLRGRVLAALLAGGGARLRGDSMQGTVNVLWALATLHRDQGERIDPAAVATLVGVATGKLQAANTAAWALAEPGHEGRAFSGKLMTAAGAQLPAFIPQHLSNTLWAAATLSQPLPPGFLGKLLAVADAQLPAFKPQELSTTAWALAKLSLGVGSGSRGLVELLDQPPSAQRLGWPKAQLQRFLDPLADEAARLLGPGSPSAADWDPQNLANTIWAFSELRHFHAGLWGEVMGEALAHWGRTEGNAWKGQDVYNLALGLARLRASERGAPDPALGRLLQRLGSRLAAERPQAFSTQEASNLAWAHAAADAPYCAWRGWCCRWPALAT